MSENANRTNPSSAINLSGTAVRAAVQATKSLPSTYKQSENVVSNIPQDRWPVKCALSWDQAFFKREMIVLRILFNIGMDIIVYNVRRTIL